MNKFYFLEKCERSDFLQRGPKLKGDESGEEESETGRQQAAVQGGHGGEQWGGDRKEKNQD